MDDQQDSRQPRRGFVDTANNAFTAGRTIWKGAKLARTAGAAGAAVGSLGPIAIGVIVGVFILVFLLVLTQGTGFAEDIPEQPPTLSFPPGNTPEEINQNIVSLLRNTPGNIDIYKQAAQTTGVSWQILAGIHYVEGTLNPNASLVSGRTIGTREPDVPSCSSSYSGPGIPIPLSSGGCGFKSLLDSAVYAGKHLAGKIGKTEMSQEELVTALSRYNGGGNRNCSNNSPYTKTPYTGCPRLYEGEDDPYALALFDTRHSTMYLVYCKDLTPCPTPEPFSRPGAMTVIRTVSNNFN